MSTAGTDHGALMDDVYRYQRLIYDITRKYYLLGRDRLISGIQPSADDAILEVACGTGRNLAVIGQRYPGRDLFGMDISEQMLVTARAKLGPRATLAAGDACAFDAQALLGRESFEHIVLSYSLSMIPDWQGAVREAVRNLAPGGTLHIVDFGDQARLPGWFKRVLRAWLAKFHVAPRDGLRACLEDVSAAQDLTLHHTPLLRGYAQYARLERRK